MVIEKFIFQYATTYLTFFLCKYFTLHQT